MSSEPGTRTTLTLIGLGIAFDYAFNGQTFGVSTPLFFCLVAAVLFTTLPDVRSRVLIVAAGVLSIFPALRASAALGSLDVLGVAGLLGLAVALDGAEVVRASTRALVLAALRLVHSLFVTPSFVARPLAPLARSVRLDRARPVLRTVFVAAPIMLVFALLLGSADQVFADVITPPLPNWNVSRVAGHVMLALAGTLITGILVRTAVAPRLLSVESVPSVSRVIPPVKDQQWTAALAGVLTLFTIFVVVQFAFLFGGRQRMLVTPGLTYAEYARSGFFQLIVVAVLTVGLVVAAWDLGERTAQRRFRMLSSGMIALAFVILASAFTRLRLYEHAFGFTVARFFAYVIIATIAVVFAALLWCLWKGKRERFGAAVLAAGVAALLCVNVANPERFVAERNVARWRVTNDIDTYYLGSVLGADAVAVAVAVLRELPPQDAAPLREALCSQGLAGEHEPSWRSVNLGRAQARRALANVRCGSPGSLAG